MSISGVTRKHALGLPRAVDNREGGRETVRIEPVQVPAGWQDRWRANEVAADDRRDEAAIQGAQEAWDFVVLGEQPIEARKFIERFARFPRMRASGCFEGGGDRASSDQGAHGCACIVKTERALGDRRQSLHALLRPRRFAEDVKAVRDKRVLKLKDRQGELADFVRRARAPARFRPGEIDGRGLRLDELRQLARGLSRARRRDSARRTPSNPQDRGKVRHGPGSE